MVGATAYTVAGTRVRSGSAVTGPICGRGDSTSIRGSQWSQRGRYQLCSPSKLSVHGKTTERIMVASRRSATATPNPICWNMSSWPRANPENTTTMMSAAPVMILAVDATPPTTASVVEPVSS